MGCLFINYNFEHSNTVTKNHYIKTIFFKSISDYWDSKELISTDPRIDTFKNSKDPRTDSALNSSWKIKLWIKMHKVVTQQLDKLCQKKLNYKYQGNQVFAMWCTDWWYHQNRKLPPCQNYPSWILRLGYQFGWWDISWCLS